ncbi:hypothetical protein KAFR_0I01970 [Kazachstania africana CBS 2517]|uniref:AB hydrolase-1 domain-containing protein n=1 Tax=Kazachstania africana (strain ATCC 22294 / BCRC 22015 / CBS 2517 / CECT 1963 / NBRC 1671 / NRRL Y-8276) TaxID=1071382 RepID=H2B027_KAZAF|nr:hypothetical protein KAFR_0I01970 [Kazachstania africana CBS 2517]CCF59977.1 hypothetical protein KAFR_0I01970 [Kazachstania africana CBS 2517]
MSPRLVASFLKLVLGHSKIKKSQVPVHSNISSAPVAIPLVKIIAQLPRLFPRSIDESFKDYRVYKEGPERMQEDLLSTLPFYPNVSKDKVARIIKTVVDEEGNYINEFCITPKNTVNSQKLKHLIFIHGYGAGFGFFLKNLESIPLLDNNWCIHAIDLPGFGFSSRKNFPFKYPTSNTSEVTAWFHERIRRWLEERTLLDNPKNNVIVAHSLGAYLMALYTQVYPAHLRKLIMCSPAGVSKSQNNSKAVLQPPWWYAKLWDMNLSPFTLVRLSKHLGSKLTSGWSYRRFKLIENRMQFEMLHRYSYAIFNQPGSGEYLLGFILECGGNPRCSLEDTLFSNNFNVSSKVEWAWIYGENDWMDIEGGRRVHNLLLEKFNRDSKFYMVPNAGHHLYLDNIRYFNNIIVQHMENV